MNSEIDITLKNVVAELADLTMQLMETPDSHILQVMVAENGYVDFEVFIAGITTQIDRVNLLLEEIPSGYKKPYQIYNAFGAYKKLYQITSNDIEEFQRNVQKQLINISGIDEYVKGFGKSNSKPNIKIPEQSPSLKLGFESGKISLLDSTALDNAGNEKAIIEALHPSLLEALMAAENELTQGNMAYGFVADKLRNYIEAVDKPIEKINFGEVFVRGKEIAAGLRLAKEYDFGGEYPQFTAEAEIRTEAVLETHKPFMLASKIGSELVASSEFYDKTPVELRAIRRDISDLKLLIENSPDLIENGTSDLVREALNVSVDREDAKNMIFATRVAKNFGIVALSGALVTGLGAGALLIPGIGLVVGPAVGAAGGLAVKKSDSMEQLLGDIKIIRAGSQKASKDAFNQLKAFVLKHAPLLRRTTSLDDNGEWFDKGLKYVKGDLLAGDKTAEDVEHKLSHTLGENDAWDLYEDKRGEYRWRRRASNGDIVGSSCEGYTSKNNCKEIAERHGMNGNPRGLGKNDNWEIYTDARHEYRWRRTARSGMIVGASSAGFVKKSDCKSNAERNGM